MTISHEDIDAGRTAVFPSLVELGECEIALLFSVLDKVARAAGHHAPAAAAGARIAGAGAAFRQRLVPGEPVLLDALLDLAAELLEVADLLVAAGLDLEALALEGVGGRLTERLLGAGPFEGTPIAAGR
jgi:hypothetical protein